MIIDPSVIRQVSREKDIDPEKMFAALEEAMSSAARKFYRDKAVVTAIDRKSGEMSVTSRRTVVEELDTESEEPPPQILLAEAQEIVEKQGTKGDVRVLRPAGEASGGSRRRRPSRCSTRRCARPSATTSTTSFSRRSAS